MKKFVSSKYGSESIIVRHQRSIKTLILLHRRMGASLEISSKDLFKMIVVMRLPQKTLKLSETWKMNAKF